MRKNLIIVICLTVISLLLYEFKSKNSKIQPQTAISLEKTESSKKALEEKPQIQPESTQDTSLIPITADSKFPTIKRIEDFDILCFRAKENIFFLPREFAVLLTHKKTTEFILPKQLASCLKEGPVKIWVTEYDPVYNLPYRYYFEIKTKVKSITPLDVAPAPFSQINSQLFGTLYLEKSYHQIALEGLEFHQFRLDHTALGPSLYADIEEVSSRRFTDADSFMKDQKFDSIFENNYLAPSSHTLNIEKLIDKEMRDLYLDSDLVLTGENIALAHYYKYRKKIKIYIEPTKSKFKKVDQRFWMSFDDFKNRQKELLILDLRSFRQSSKLKIMSSQSFQFQTRGVNYPHAVVTAFNNPDLRNLINDQINNKIFIEVLSLLQANPKTAVIYTTGPGDSLHKMLHSKLPMNLKLRTYGLKEGFHHLFIYSYFFGGFSFESNGEKINPADHNLLKNYLLLGY